MIFLEKRQCRQITAITPNSIGKSAFLATDHTSQNGEMPWMPPV